MDKSKWEYKKLTDVCSILYGYPFDSKCFNENNQGRPLIRIRDVVRGFTETYTTEDCSDDYIIKEGEYLVGMDGEFNISAWKSAPALLNQRVCKITADGKSLTDGFMYYLMKTKLKEIEGETAFVTVKHLSAKVLNKVNVHLPSVDDQQRIAAELDCLNEMIALKQEQLKEFDKLAQSIFYDMFGDPSHNDKDWDIKLLKDISKDKLSYGSGASAVAYDGQLRYIRITDIDDFGELKDDVVSPSVFDEKYLLNDGDILFARSGATVGKTYCHNYKYGNCIYAGYLIRLIPNRDIVLPSYVFGYTKTPYYRSFVEGAQRAVAQPNINAKQYGDLKICVPPLTLQQQFAEKIQAIEAQKELVKKSIAETQQLLDSRMDYYFN